MTVVGDFQEEQQHLLLIPQHNSKSNLLCTGDICMNITKNFFPLHNDSIPEITPLSSNVYICLRVDKSMKSNLHKKEI